MCCQCHTSLRCTFVFCSDTVTHLFPPLEHWSFKTVLWSSQLGNNSIQLTPFLFPTERENKMQQCLHIIVMISRNVTDSCFILHHAKCLIMLDTIYNSHTNLSSVTILYLSSQTHSHELFAQHLVFLLGTSWVMKGQCERCLVQCSYYYICLLWVLMLSS